MSFLDQRLLKLHFALAVSSFITFSTIAGNILPFGYTLPSEPNSQAGGCASCTSSGSPEAVFLNSSGFAKMDVNLNTLSSINHGLLLLELGKTTAFSPTTIYQLLMPGAKDGLQDSILVRIGDQNIGFDLSASTGDANRMRSASHLS